MKLSNHFTKKEMECPCCGAMKMEEDVIQAIEAVRCEYGKPIYINSAFRCPKHNVELGSKSSSSHLVGLAIDIRVNSSKERYGLMRHLLQHFTRLGFGDGFIHADLDHVNKTPNLIWDYYKKHDPKQ